MFVNYVNKLPVTDPIKEKLRALVAKMPSPALRTVVNNIHEYIRRFEAEVHRDLIGLSSAPPPLVKGETEQDEEVVFQNAEPPKKKVVATWADDEFTIPTSTEVKNGSTEEDREEAGSTEEEIPAIKWVNACESDTPGGPAPDGEREGDRLHADLPDRDVSDGGLGGELLGGREPAAEGGPTVEGERDDRLRSDADGPAGLQGGGDAD